MDGPDNRRASRRTKTFEVVSLSLDGVAHRAHLLDFSPDGAQVHVRSPLGVDQEVVLKSDHIDRRATVRWQSTAGRGGLQFSKRDGEPG